MRNASKNSPYSIAYKSLRKRRCEPCELIFDDLAALERHQEQTHRVRFIKLVPSAPDGAQFQAPAARSMRKGINLA